jgi:hypothetical protein
VARHEHDDGDHGHPGEAHEHPGSGGEEEQLPDASGWLASSPKTTCPACGAPGALMLGGGVFCPGCGDLTTNPGYRLRSGEDPAAGSDPGPD